MSSCLPREPTIPPHSLRLHPSLASSLLASWSYALSPPRPCSSVLRSPPGCREPQHFPGCTVVYQMFGVRAVHGLAVLVTAQWKHRCSLEEQGRNKCFSHAINNVAGKDVVKVVLWVLPGGMFSSFFFFLLPSSPQPPFIQCDAEHLPPGIRGKQLCSKGRGRLNC